MISPLIGPASPKKRRNGNARMAKPSSRKVVLSIPHRDRTEVPDQVNVRSDTEGSGINTQGAMSEVQHRTGRRARDARSYSQCEYSAEVQCGACIGAIEGKVGDSDQSEIWPKAECEGIQILVQGILCQYGRAG